MYFTRLGHRWSGCAKWYWQQLRCAWNVWSIRVDKVLTRWAFQSLPRTWGACCVIACHRPSAGACRRPKAITVAAFLAVKMAAHIDFKTQMAIISTVHVEQDVQMMKWIVIKCTTLKQCHAIDVHMFVNVMHLVHLYRHCVRHGRPLDELYRVVFLWCSCVPSHVLKAN